MCHHTWLMEGWLSIDKEYITIAKVSVDHFFADLQLVSNSISVLLGHVLEQDLLAGGLVLNHVGTRVHGSAISYEFAKALNIDIGNTFRECQLACHKHWHSNLVCSDVRIG